jgi:glycosyltransferase involved in cell wall biosynthesis
MPDGYLQATKDPDPDPLGFTAREIELCDPVLLIAAKRHNPANVVTDAHAEMMNPRSHVAGQNRLVGGSSLLSVVVPCYNESEVIGLFYNAIRPVLQSLVDLDYEIVFVDDGSADDTLDQLNRIALQDANVRVCSLSRNFGHQISLTAGLDFAAGDAVLMMDSDLQHPPSLIPELVTKWREGYDVVSGVRRRTDGETWVKNLTSRLFYVLLNSLSSTRIPPGTADFGLISARVRQALLDMPERHRFLRGMISWVGFRRVLVPYDAPRRAAGETTYTMVKMVALALDAVFSFSAEPLRLTLRAGATIAFLGFVYLGWTLIYGYVIRGLVPGYASLIGVTLILGGCQIFFIGLIGQYLARVFEEVKGRPLYLVKQRPCDSRRAAAAVL